MLLDTVTRASEAHNVKITTFTLDPTEKGADSNALDMRGSYGAIKAFISDVSDISEHLAIRQLTIRRTAQAPEVEGRVTLLVTREQRP